MRTMRAAAALFFISIILCACPLKVTVERGAGDSLSAAFSSRLGEAFAENLSQMQGASGGKAGLDGIAEKIQGELDGGFFSDARVRFGKNALDAGARVADIKRLPPDFARVKTDGSKKTLELALTPRSLAAAVLQEDSAAKTLADILMAPIISGEEMSRQEYRELLCDIYGEPLADELLAGDLTVEFISGGKKQVKKIPVADLLLSARGVSFEFEY